MVEAPDEVDRIRAARAEPPRLVLVGPFNTGKSTLLKRLCVDEGVPVPEGLIIQAEPSTTTVEAARIGSWLVVDTPGLESQHLEHVQASIDAAMQADRVLLLLTHDLFSDSSATAALLRRLPAGTVDIVLSRVDKAVMSPSAEALEAWVQPKAQAARERAAMTGHPDVHVFTVAADVRGRVRNQPADRQRFDRGREWDGMAELREVLNAAPDEEDRRRTTIRRGVLLIEKATAVIDDAIRSMEAKRATADTTRGSLASAVAKIEELEDDARAALMASLREAACSGPAASARHRVLVTADKELERLRRRVRDIAKAHSVEEPGWSVDLSLALQVPLSPEDDVEAMNDVDFDVTEVLLRRRIDDVSGDPACTAQLEEDLKNWRRAERRGTSGDYYAAEDTPFDGLGDVRDAEKALADFHRREVAVRAGHAVLDAWREERRLREQQRDRALAEKAARDRVEALATTIAAMFHDAPGCVHDAFSGVVSQVKDREATVRGEEERLCDAVHQLRHTREELRGLLDHSASSAAWVYMNSPVDPVVHFHGLDGLGPDVSIS